MNCTACGTPLTEGSKFCNSCGAQMGGVPTAPRSPGTIAQSASDPWAETLDRWGVESSPPLITGIVLAAISLVVGLFAHISLLTAESQSGEFGLFQATSLQGVHAVLWFNVAGFLGILAVAFLVVARSLSRPTQTRKVAPNPDLTVAFGLSALIDHLRTRRCGTRHG